MTDVQTECPDQEPNGKDDQGNATQTPATDSAGNRLQHALDAREARKQKPHVVTGTWERPFFDALRECPVIGTACDAVGVSRRGVFDRRRSDPKFEQDMLDAIEDGLDRLEAAMFKRGRGVKRTVYDKHGEARGEQEVASDYAAQKMLEARRPETWHRPRKEILREQTEVDPAEVARQIRAQLDAMDATVPAPQPTQGP